MSLSEAPQKGFERVVYDDRIVRAFVWATVIWGIVGMIVGLTLALQLAWWPATPLSPGFHALRHSPLVKPLSSLVYESE